MELLYTPGVKINWTKAEHEGGFEKIVRMLSRSGHRVLMTLQRKCSNLSQLMKCPAVTEPLNFLAGRRIALDTSRDQIPLQYPATGEVLCSMQLASKMDVDRAVTAAKDAQVGWARMSGFHRGQVLKRAADIIRSRLEEIARLETLDTGKPIWEARLDMQSCADTIEYYGGLAASIAGEFLPLSDGCYAYTIREALGVVGGIGAWNYPLQMASWKSAPALACGNSFVFKPSELTPLTAVVLGEVYKEAGLPDGCYNVVQGGGEVGQLLCSHDLVDKISFTGSVPVGSKIMEACAKGVKHVTLELGGKSPLIIFDDCHLDNAVSGAMMANFLTQGQVCSNGTRVFIQKKIITEFLEKLVKRTKRMKIGDPFNDNTTVGATISRQQADKVLRYVNLAKQEGAEVLCGGQEVTPEERFKGKYAFCNLNK
ncbi:hypothetical protein DPMN_107742 [Dreissena polymorpha]|uniref:Aldehyde dehydrogenase domain-containing protein n=1 Tax=Dreissena polymorpha TaxID=45954 RepID=A0A9D4QK56_DREPO|nr:hypothetical protein DPMN_107742 [Dreissena polymorpha]